MKAKQTAVEYLVDQLFPKALSIEQYHHIEQAKEMERQQIINAVYDAQRTDFYVHYYEAEEYYNEKFNTK
jgi:hypothetical protein